MNQRHAAGGPQPVFADGRGRRRVIIRWLAIGAGGIVATYVVLAAVGMLGGPRVPGLPWPRLHAAHRALADPRSARDAARTGSHQPGGAGGAQVLPSPSPQVSPNPSARPSATASPSATTTMNPAGRTPPGQNRTKTPSPRGTRPT